MRKRNRADEGSLVRTRNVKEPVSGPSDVSDEGKELGVALIQSLILTAEGEYTTERFLWSAGIIDFASNPETHFWSGKLAI